MAAAVSSAAIDNNPLAATVEDCYSDDERIPANTDARTPPNEPNAAKKRSSQASNLGKDSRTERVAKDAASDSGYSSRTAATNSSADSKQSMRPATSTKRDASTVPTSPTKPKQRPPTATRKDSTGASRARSNTSTRSEASKVQAQAPVRKQSVK
ncbi:hypothetical protein LTS18_014206, partial [Coniosporium uncinatum]